MSDGVTIGASSAPVNPSVLMELFGGGETAQSRIQRFQKAKEEAQAALEALKLGKEAKAAYDDALAKQAAAFDALKDAQSKSSSMLLEAKAKSDAMIADASTKRDAALSLIEKERGEHSAWVSAQAASANAKTADAQKTLTEATATRDQANTLRATLDQKIKDADAAIAAANAREQKFKAATEQLYKSIADQIGAAYTAT